MLRAPRHLPSFELLLADLGLTQRDIAKHLGVTERAVRKWKAAGTAPRPVLLALYWESRWGRSAAETTLFNEAQANRAWAESLAVEVRRLGMALHLTDQLGGETANSPAFHRA